MGAALLLTLMLCGAGLALAWASRRWQQDPATVVDAVDALLPQTQCAQCGYPGCRPYAEAVVAGAPPNLCPPGGANVHAALVKLLGAEHSQPPASATVQIARIDEAECIGCFLCVEACPVDAIIGAPRFMHTVLQDHCTGCELCIEPCPVDCIELVAAPAAPKPQLTRHQQRWPERPAQACIRCGECEPACPVDLQPQQMLWFGDAAEEDLSRCIECGLCNQVCPSNINLADNFQQARLRLDALALDVQHAAKAKARFDKRQNRRQHHQGSQQARRGQRLATRGQRQW